MNFKLVIFSSTTAFVLSFFTALISGAGFLRSLLRAIIVAVFFGGLSVGLNFLFEKVLDLSSSNNSNSDNSEPSQPQPLGNKVDITIDDEELKEEDYTPSFVLTGQNQMLNKDDLSNGSQIQKNMGSSKLQKIEGVDNPKEFESTEVVEEQKERSVSNQEVPSFKPVALGQSSSSSTSSSVSATNVASSASSNSVSSNSASLSSTSSSSDEFPSIEATLGNASFLNPDAGVSEEDNIDTLPDMVGGSPLHDDTVTDSEFASGSKSTSRLSDPVFPDGSMAESKDSTLMAEAIRTILKKGE